MRLLALLVAAALVGRAHSHGFLADPPARNVLANSDYCPQCLSAGGERWGPREGRRRVQRLPLALSHWSPPATAAAAARTPDAFTWPDVSHTPAIAPSPHLVSGPAVVSGGAAWPGGKWGHCGDPAAGPLRHEAGGAMWTAGGSGKPVAVWRAGDIVTLTSRLTAFHKGRLGFRICRIQGTGESLVQLARAAGEGAAPGPRSATSPSCQRYGCMM